MSTSTEFQAAPEWEIWSGGPADVQDFTQLLQGENDRAQFNALSALGILHAAQTYMSGRSAQEATLVHNHDEPVWDTARRQLSSTLSTFGYRLRLRPALDDPENRSMYTLFEGPMPSPNNVLRAPGLAYLRTMLAYRTKKGGQPRGFKYVTFSQEQLAEDTIVLGFANPTEGIRLELGLPVGPLKAKYPFPPPPLKPLTFGGGIL